MNNENLRIIIQLYGNDVDVTHWIDKHPGGKKILKIFGNSNRDVTQQFIAIHKDSIALNILKQLPQTKSEYINDKKSKYIEAENEFNELIKILRPKLSKPNAPYELLKLFYVLIFFIAGYILCFSADKTAKYSGLALLCLAQYQSGWVAHDYSHRSVLHSPGHNNLAARGLGLLQGYCDCWWKARHNTHHMLTNELHCDPDIKTEPIFHFYDININHLQLNKHIPYQNYIFIFFLSLLDLYWRYESITICFKPGNKKYLIDLLFHYTIFIILLIYTKVTILDLLILSLIRGFMTASIVFANHYPEDRILNTHNMGLFEQTLLTSRNTTGYFFHNSNKNSIGRWIFNEFSGYLSMQIEHHLVPTWPSGNLMQLRPYIIAIANKHNIPYRESSVIQALYDNIIKLTDPSIKQLKNIQ